MNIKDIVKDNTVHFNWYRNGIAYYRVAVLGVVYEFPVPLSDIGGATLLAKDKAITFMRYIRQAMNDSTFVRVEY